MQVRADGSRYARRALLLILLVGGLWTLTETALAQEDGGDSGRHQQGAYAEAIATGSSGDPDPRPGSPDPGERWRSFCTPFYYSPEDNPGEEVYKQFGKPDASRDNPPGAWRPGVDHWWREGYELTLDVVMSRGLNPTGRYQHLWSRCQHVTGYESGDPTDPDDDSAYLRADWGEGFIVAFEEPISLDELLERARSEIALPTPEPSFAPAPEGMLAQLETWLWLDMPWEPIEASAEAGWVTATVTATPIRTIWEMGDGDEVLCPGPGEPWQRAYADMDAPCGHTYIHSSDITSDGLFHGEVGVEWEFTWELVVDDEVEDGGLVDPDDPTEIASTDFTADVDEIQAIGS